MSVLQHPLKSLRGFLLSYGPTSVKKAFWEKEFTSGKWNFIDETASDCVYGPLERFSKQGDILDLGCGPGNTGNEVAASAYKTYVGVDISEAALEKGRQRSQREGRADRNRFEQGDFMGYKPSGKYDVVLFRESLYHVPIGKVREVLDKYAAYLKKDGVLMVRLFVRDRQSGVVKERPTAMMKLIEDQYDVVEKGLYDDSKAMVIVFRKRA